MIDQATIDRILDAAHIEEVVGEFVTLRRAGVNYKGLCPFHDEKTPSFMVSPSKGLCKCFSCGKGGNVVHFIMEHEQLNYYEALKWLAGKYHIEFAERELSNEEKQARNARESMFVMNEFGRDYFQNILYNHTEGNTIGLAYFRQRGFRDDIIRKFQLGYSLNQHDALYKEAVGKGYKEEFLVRTGLCYKRDSDGQLRDRYWGRVIFPVHTLSGKVVAFGGRVLKTDAKTAKYVNSPESEIYHKSSELYGIYFAKQAIVKADRCFLVEGYTDVISMHQSGIENVVASSGTSLTSGQIRLIHRFTNNITVLYDGDSAGIKASLRGIDMLLEEGMNIKVVLLPDGDDPDSFARKHNATDYQKYINSHEVDFIRFKTGLLLKEAGDDPIKRAGLISDIVKSISVIPSDIIRRVYITECCQLLGIEERLMVAEIAKVMQQRVEERAKYGGKTYNQVLTERQNKAQPAVDNSPGNINPPSTDDSLAAIIATMPDGADALPTMPVVENGSLHAESSPQNYTSYIPVQSREGTVFYEKEVLIMQTLVRYGERVLFVFTDELGQEVKMTVIEYVNAELRGDELQFHNEMHRDLLADAMSHVHDNGFVAERYFLSHSNPGVSKIAADLISERYQLSKIHSRFQKVVTEEERLHEVVPRLIIDFKLAIVTEELQHTLRAMQNPDVLSDISRLTEVQLRYKTLNEVKQTLAKKAGDRVILLK